MELINTESSIKRAALLGLFDGVHIGHATALKALKETGADNRIVYTFFSRDVRTKGERKLILTDREKENALLSAGATRVVFADFCSVRDLKPREFVEKVLLGELGADTVICGENYRFGKDASGGKDDLKLLCGEFGIKTLIVPAVYYDGEVVSTTRIRGLIECGRIKEANRLLGYDYFISGEVVRGNSLGRRMGIRTINLEADPEKIIPAGGVYSSDVVIGSEKYKGITNVGTKPTVSSDGKIGIETHILDYSGDLYGKTASIFFKDYYREERKFSSFTDLQAAINKDIKRRREEG